MHSTHQNLLGNFCVCCTFNSPQSIEPSSAETMFISPSIRRCGVAKSSQNERAQTTKIGVLAMKASCKTINNCVWSAHRTNETFLRKINSNNSQQKFDSTQILRLIRASAKATELCSTNRNSNTGSSTDARKNTTLQSVSFTFLFSIVYSTRITPALVTKLGRQGPRPCYEVVSKCSVTLHVAGKSLGQSALRGTKELVRLILSRINHS